MKKIIRWFSETVSWFDGLPWAQKAFYRVGMVGTSLIVATYSTWELTGLGAAYRDAPVVYRELEADGTPLSRAGFLASLAVPEEDNAYNELSPIVAQINKLVFQRNEREFTFVGLRSSSTEEIEAEVVAFRPLLERAKGAMRRPLYLGKPYFDSAGFHDGLKHFPNELGRFFAKQAFLDGINDDHASAKENLALSLRTAKYTESTPMLWANSTYRDVAHAVLRILQLRPEAAPAYIGIVNEPPSRRDRTARSFAFLHLDDYRSMRWYYFFNQSFLHDGFPYTSQRSGLPQDPLARAYAGKALRIWQTTINRRQHQSGDIDQPWPWSLGFVDRGTWLGDSNDGEIRSIAAMVVVLNYKQEHGEWPPDLRSAGFTSEDPYRPGYPLRYKVFQEGPRIWSIGRDKRDNNGETREERKARITRRDEFVDYGDDSVITLIPPIPEK